MKAAFDELLTQIDTILAKEENPLQAICTLLNTAVSYYNWVGFYVMDHDRSMLTLGPYAGAATEHTEIPFGRGICGQVAAKGETMLVQDVHAESNYLACSIETKSEIVLPIYKNEHLVAQLDIDSHVLNAFTNEDQLFLETVCEKVAHLM